MAEKELKLYDSFLKNNQIDNKYYEKYQVKRGLRNQDGTGVMAGVTNICNVHGYIVNEGEKEPDEGELTFRGYSIKELINNVEKEKRFGYEEIVYLLLSGELPSKEQLKQFNSLIDENRQLPNDFFGDMILKAPSLNIMNKLSRSVLSLYSYDDCPDMITPKHEIDTAISVISKLPVIMVLAYYVKQSAYCGESMIMHPIIPGQSTAETILSTLRKDRQFTDEEAKILDVVLMLHAEHGGGNNSTFSCRVLSSSGTDPYSAYAAAIGSLKGPKHGGANHKVSAMQRFIRDTVKNWNSDGEIVDCLRKIVNKEAFDKTGLIYGMGHAVYTLSDPRALILKSNAEKMAKGTEFEAELKLIEKVEELSPMVFKEVKGDSKIICANVDMYSGFVYKMLGIPEDLYTPLFAVSRMAGWSAHRFEELVSGRRIIRPAYKSVTGRKEYISIDDRK
ncbi:MAG: citrate/2-methylcitrate synthase [Lachnospiraceae bacterium]|nr:citrate/2-methylcitrate synthase [Lachnospiraceae bacterium]MDE6253294.1 citrate/2-methylcitrate synthase [Lachnospiraceae bacterium]